MDTTIMEPELQQLVEDELRRICISELGGEDDFGMVDVMASGVVPRLIHLLQEHHRQPADVHEPLVRRLVVEYCYVAESGRTAPRLSIERQVRMVVRALERVRQSLVKRGGWSDLPAAPIMFG